MARPPFDMLRGAFWLIAVIVLSEIGLTVFAGVGCFWLILDGQSPLGSCRNVVEQIREVWAEVLAAVLALIIAARGPPSPPPDDKGEP